MKDINHTIRITEAYLNYLRFVRENAYSWDEPNFSYLTEDPQTSSVRHLHLHEFSSLLEVGSESLAIFDKY